MTAISKVGLAGLIFGAAITCGSVTVADDTAAFSATLRPVLEAACDAPYADAQRLRRAMPEARIIAHKVALMGGAPGRSETTMIQDGGKRIEISALFPGGRLRRIGIEWANERPLFSLSADDRCQVTEARQIAYAADGTAQSITVFGPDLTRITTEIALNPAVPPARDPGGVAVGLIDSGVNYTIAPFLDRLGRDAGGALVGRDLWDMDDKPFDIDTSRSPFFPLHHGSAVMSVLIREAPTARVLPIRYPRPDMSRMAVAVAFLADQGAVIVNLAMGSNDSQEWAAFAEAARQHPQMLFVISAGNDGRDIDTAPVYPAALGLSNSIVVTSSELDGRLAQGSNWGSAGVDVMVPGERIEVIDHRGASGRASGSSFAVPRVSALAVRLLAANPDWRGPELRDAILKRARQTAGPKLTRYGWIPDPTDGP